MEHWDSKSPEDYHNLVSNRDARICLNLAQFFHGPVELTYYRNKQARLFINEKVGKFGKVAQLKHGRIFHEVAPNLYYSLTKLC